MTEKRRVRGLSPAKPGVWRSAKKKIIDSTEFIKYQQHGLIESFKGAKVTTKIVLSAVTIAFLLIGTISISNLLN